MVFSVLNHVFMLKPVPPTVIEALIWCNIVQKYSEFMYMVHLSQKVLKIVMHHIIHAVQSTRSLEWVVCG